MRNAFCALLTLLAVLLCGVAFAAPPGQATTANAEVFISGTVPAIVANAGGCSGLIGNTDAILVYKQPPVAVAKDPRLKSAAYTVSIANTESSFVVALRIKPLSSDLVVMKPAKPADVATTANEVNRFGSAPNMALIGSEVCCGQLLA